MSQKTPYISDGGICVLTSRPYQSKDSLDTADIEKLVKKAKKLIEPENLNTPVELIIADSRLKSQVLNTVNEQRILSKPLEAIEQAGIALIDSGDIDENDLMNIDEDARELVEEMEVLNHRKVALEEVMNQMSSLESSTGFDIHKEFCTRMASKLDRWDNSSLKKKFGNQKKYAQFRQRLAEALPEGSGLPSVKDHLAALDGKDDDDESSGDELEVAGGAQSFKCPLCLKFLENPLVSMLCKHSCCKNCFESLLKDSRHQAVQCPNVGCDKMLSLRNVEPDEGLKRRVKQAKMRQERMQEEEYFDDEDDDRSRTATGEVVDEKKAEKAKKQGNSNKGGPQRRRRIVVEDDED